MALHHNPRIVTRGIIFCVDPADPGSWNGNTATLKDTVGNKTLTLGSDTIASTTYGKTHFSSRLGEDGTGSLDTGYRYGSITNNDKVVGGDTSFTVILWLYKTGANPNNWWHIVTDGHSGDILTINEAGSMVISMNSSYGGAGAAGTYDINWNQAKNDSWNMVGVRYNINNAQVDAFIGNPDSGMIYSSPIATSPIDTNYKIRNFVGWGSAQSSYHADPSHSHCAVYNTHLTDDEILQNFEALKVRFQ